MHVRPRSALAAGAVLALGLSVPPALAEDDVFVPNTPTTPVFLTCDGPTKEGFTNGMLALLEGRDSVAVWGPDEPASVTTGAGCGKVDEPLFGGTRPGTPFQHTITGTYEGNLDTLTVTVHSADYGTSRATDGPTTLDVRATVDGLSLFGVTMNESAAGDMVPSPADVPVTVTPVATGATGGVRAFSFSITGIDLLLPEDDEEHDIVIDMSAGLDGQNWLWGAAEAPSGVVFTPEAVESAKLKAARRSTRK